jgi:hypothetical protein
VSFCFQDWLLDRFRDHEDIVADALERFKVDFALPINYSVYRNFPRLDQLIAMKRRMRSLKLFQDRGINVVPDIGAIRPIDVDRWGDWVLNEGCSAVFMTVQTLRGRKKNPLYEIKFDMLLQLRERLGKDVRFLVQGVSARRMPYFRAQLGKASFINHAAWVRAEFKLDFTGGPRGTRDAGRSVQDTFSLNVSQLKAILYEAQSSAISSTEGA